MDQTPDFPAPLPLPSLPPEAAAQLPPAPPPQPTGSPNLSTGAPTTVSDQVIASARDLPDFIHKATEFDPDVAKKWTGTALLASKTMWGTLIGMGVSWVVTRFGLGWDADTSAEVTGVIVMLLTAALRSITDTPITGVLSAKTSTDVAMDLAVKAENKGTPIS